MIARVATEKGVTPAQVERDLINTQRPSSLIRRLTTAEEVASLAVYLASAQASATTGAAMCVDGGVARSVLWSPAPAGLPLAKVPTRLMSWYRALAMSAIRVAHRAALACDSTRGGMAIDDTIRRRFARGNARSRADDPQAMGVGRRGGSRYGGRVVQSSWQPLRPERHPCLHVQKTYDSYRTDHR
jgi:hypothetical protein